MVFWRTSYPGHRSLVVRSALGVMGFIVCGSLGIVGQLLSRPAPRDEAGEPKYSW